jgi:signal peptidase I
MFTQWGDKAVPKVRYPEDGIQVTGVPVFGKSVDTNSMLPVFDIGHTLLMKPVTCSDPPQVGDIVDYERDDGFKATHRIVQIIKDKQGIWYKTKGDNNIFADNKLVHFSQLNYVVIGILY